MSKNSNTLFRALICIISKSEDKCRTYNHTFIHTHYCRANGSKIAYIRKYEIQNTLGKKSLYDNCEIEFLYSCDEKTN